MRWADFDASMRSALGLVAVLLVLGLSAAAMSWQLQERWPLVVFLLAFFGVLLFLGGVSLWQRMTEPRRVSLPLFKRATMFQMSLEQKRSPAGGWSLARAICLLLLLVFLAAFLIHSFSIGGDAVRGYTSGGRYFVRVHTAVTEVSSQQWLLNRRLAMALFALLPLSFVITVVAGYMERHARFRYRDLDMP